MELKMTVFTYLSRNLLEMPHLTKYVTLNNVNSITWIKLDCDQYLQSGLLNMSFLLVV